MPQPDHAGLDAELEALLELDAGLRQARLDAVARDDPGRARVLGRLLELAGSAQTAGLRAAPRPSPSDDAPPDIPGYRIERELGRGGMGAVYEAVREVEGSEQRVAVKLLRGAGLDPAESERLVTEQRILARLQHPNIAVLLDAGRVDGRPYLVLERIEGVPIDQRIQPPAAPEAVLSAVAQVADALELAHAHFVVHRDIKPENVLVDADGRIKLIDFGIAKLLERADFGDTPATRTGAAPMTLRYASPEQLLAQPVGVPSDLYQLGLLMFRLLTGAWPFDESPQQLPTLRTRADVEPLPPSRAVADPRLRRRLAGDIDAIVLRCLRRDPAQRYRSAAELRSDIRRHLEHRPVAARRRTRLYLARSFVLRHRLGVALGTSALLLLVVGAASALALAERSRQYAERSERILDTVTEMFAPANPFGGEDARRISVAEAVDRAGERFLGEVDTDPAFHVAMLERLGEMQEAMRAFDDQRRLLERALAIAREHGLPRATRERIGAAVAEAMFGQSDFGAIDPLLAAERPGASREYGMRLDYVAAKLAYERGEDARAQALLEGLVEDLGRTTLDPLFHSHVHNTRGILLSRLGRLDEAQAAYRSALEHLDPEAIEHQEAMVVLPVNLAIALGRGGDYAGSERVFRDALERATVQVGPSHPTTLMVARNFSTLLTRTGRYASAMALVEAERGAALAVDERSSRAAFLARFADIAFHVGRGEEALVALLDSLELRVGVLGADSPMLADGLAQLAWMLFEWGEDGRAERLASVAAARGPRPDARAALVLRLAADRRGEGASRAPQIDEAGAGGCAGLHYRALRSLLVEGRAPRPERLPDDCFAPIAARLAALGYDWSPPWRAGIEPEAFASPLLDRLLGPPGTVPSPPAVQLARADRLLEQLDTASP